MSSLIIFVGLGFNFQVWVKYSGLGSGKEKLIFVLYTPNMILSLPVYNVCE